MTRKPPGRTLRRHFKMPDFGFADSEFEKQATILSALVVAIDAVALRGDIISTETGASKLPPVPAGSQNTMAAAAIVLLAAHFEEYIRQKIEEYSKAILVHYDHLEEKLKSSFMESYWRSGVSKLSDSRLTKSPAWTTNAEPMLRGLIEYPISGNIASFKPEYIYSHSNNMRWNTVCEISGRVGVKSLAEAMCKSKLFRDVLNNPRKGDYTDAIESKMNEFYELCNRIVHSISYSSGVGTTIVDMWLNFFKKFTLAFSVCLEESFVKFEEQVNTRKKVSTKLRTPQSTPGH